MKVTGSLQKLDQRGERWRVVLCAGVDATGKRVRRSWVVRGRKSDAQKVLTEKMLEARAGVSVTATVPTVAVWLRGWLDGPAMMRTTPKTLQEYRSAVECRIIPALGRCKLDTLSPATIQAAWSSLLTCDRKDGKEGQGLSPKSVRNCHGILRAALNTAVRHGVIPRNPCDLTELPRARKQESAVLDADQITRLLDAVRGTSLYLPVLLAVTTGMRRGEVLALRWSDVDLEGGTITVARSVEQTKGQLRYKEPKNGRTRKVTMPSFLSLELRRHREETGRVVGLVVCNEDGSPRSPTAVTQQFGRLVRTLDLPQVRYHDLRHSAATLLLRLGVELPVVSEVLGHSAVSTTANIYSHVLQKGREEAASRLDNALRRAQGE